MLTELSKVDAPSILLEDFNYFLNKAIIQYVNKRYNIFDVSQQTSDDLSVLTTSAELDPFKDKSAPTINIEGQPFKIANAEYFVKMPNDYLHLLNCTCYFRLLKDYRCNNINDIVKYPAKRITSDSFTEISRDYYNKPSPQCPYFYITNENNQTRLDIKFGDDNSIFDLCKVIVNYLRIPKYVKLTEEQLDNYKDISEELEFPNYVVHEIINELVGLIMANTADPRLQTFIPVNQSIANPVQNGQQTK